MARKSSKENTQDGSNNSRKKGGVKAALHDFLFKLIAYWEVMVIYIEKNVNIFVRKLVLSSIWIFSALFFIFIALAYFSFGIFLSLQKFLINGDPILASFLTALIFFLVALFFIEVVLKSKK